MLEVKELEKILTSTEKAEAALIKAESDLRKISEKLVKLLKATGEDKNIKSARAVEAGMLPGQLIRHIKGLINA